MVLESKNMDMATYLVKHILQLAPEDEYQAIVKPANESNNPDIKEYLELNKKSAIEAIKEGNVDKLKSSLKRGVDVNAVDEMCRKNNPDINLLFYYGTIYGNGEILKYLADNKYINIKAKDGNGFSAMHYAEKGHNIGTTQYLIDNGFNVNVMNNLGKTPIVHAIKHGDIGMVDYLIDHGANINTVDIKNRTLLHHAIKYGQFDIVKYLVDKGININALDDSNLSAFNYAANSNNKQIIEYLQLKQREQQQIENIKTLVDEKDCKNAIELIKGIKDINMPDVFGNTLLHWAVCNEYKEIVEELLKRKDININAVNKQKNTALHLAVMSNNIEITELLVDNRANINTVNEYRQTPYMCALNIKKSTGKREMVDYFRSKQELMETQKQLETFTKVTKELNQRANSSILWNQLPSVYQYI